MRSTGATRKPTAVGGMWLAVPTKQSRERCPLAPPQPLPIRQRNPPLSIANKFRARKGLIEMRMYSHFEEEKPAAKGRNLSGGLLKFRAKGGALT